MNDVIANLRSIPFVTGKAEQFIGPAGSGPPSIAGSEQYADLEMHHQSVACTNFDAFEHSQLVANVTPIQAESNEAFRVEWANGTNKFTDTFETFASKIGAAIAEKWQGPTGDAVSTSIVDYTKGAAKTADASNLVARQVGVLADQLDRTKTNFPAEPAATFPGKVAGLFGADGWDDERREEAKRQAVQLLSTVYFGSGISPTAQSMPIFPEVQSPVADSPGGPTGGPGSPFSGSPSPSGAPGSPSTGPNAPGQPGTPEGPGTNPGSLPGEDALSGLPTDAAQTLGDLGSEELGSPDSPASTTSASAMPGGVPGMGGGGIGGGAGGIGGGGVGGSLGSPAAPAAPAGGPAAGMAGAAGMGGARAAGAGAGGMRGGMGMAPMGGARGAGGGNDDEEHKTPDYLKNDELRQWVDEQAGRGYAPVIGAQRPPQPADNTGSTKQQ
ncbi:MAG: hypothetical protein GX610_09610 [Rhodococcus sp.]|nr:hypothetical protein [Rhodococcus sp. (in: high G+C Gram-positive bacteria)]